MAPSFSQYKYYNSFITEYSLALQNFTSCVVKIIQNHAELPVIAAEGQKHFVLKATSWPSCVSQCWHFE